MVSTLADSQSRELLRSEGVARLGCITNGEPYVVPINYYYEDNCVYSHSLPGLKITALRKNPRACVQADKSESPVRWRSVLAFGNFEEIITPSERHEVMSRLLKRFPMLTPVESSIIKDGIPLEVIIYRIRIDRMTGVGEG